MEDPKEIAALGVKYQLMSRCTNYLAIDVNLFLSLSGFFQPGDTAHVQAWFRDPPDAFGAALSDGIALDLGP